MHAVTTQQALALPPSRWFKPCMPYSPGFNHTCPIDGQRQATPSSWLSTTHTKGKPTRINQTHLDEDRRALNVKHLAAVAGDAKEVVTRDWRRARHQIDGVRGGRQDVKTGMIVPIKMKMEWFCLLPQQQPGGNRKITTNTPPPHTRSTTSGSTRKPQPLRTKERANEDLVVG